MYPKNLMPLFVLTRDGKISNNIIGHVFLSLSKHNKPEVVGAGIGHGTLVTLRNSMNYFRKQNSEEMK